MVIGSGFMASAFQHYKDSASFCIFASGVSNSQEENQLAFGREMDLLTEVCKDIQGRTLVYFSSCSIYDTSLTSSRYVQHKLNMESYIATRVDKFYIFRISNPIGPGLNKNTFVFRLFDQILKGKVVTLWGNAERNIIDVEDLVKISDYFLRSGVGLNEVINIVGPTNYKMTEILEVMEQIAGKKAKVKVVERGAPLKIDFSHFEAIKDRLNLNFGKDYLKRVFTKYLSST